MGCVYIYMHLPPACLTKRPRYRIPRVGVRVLVVFQVLLPCDGDFGLLDLQVGSEGRAGYFAAVQAVAEVTAGFGKELVVVYLDRHGFAEAGGFHDCGAGG